MSRSLRGPLLGYARLKSAMYATEGLLSPMIDALLTRRRPRLPSDDRDLFQSSRAALEELLKRDVENIAAGVYPLEVLRPESPVKHLLRIPEMLAEGVRLARRRARHEAHEFTSSASDVLGELPEYYRRNFHYQGDGYLSERSARLYEHQVEVLFAGAADAMRRLILPPLRQHFEASDGRGLRILELGAGTGAATRLVRSLFPKAHIVAVDLSGPYLKIAQERLKNYLRHDFIEANAESLPFQDGWFDAVFSVFLFHELPEAARVQVMAESMRVLKDGGFIGMVDAIQKGDNPRLDKALEQFPLDFHEPFFKNYTLKPMEYVFSAAGANNVSTDVGFYSKVTSGMKPGEGEAKAHAKTSRSKRSHAQSKRESDATRGS